MTDQHPYLAHLSDDGRKQTVLDHLKGTADRCAAFAVAFGAEEQGRLAGLAHDLGKYSDAFQRRLTGGEPVDHSTAGAFECMQANSPSRPLRWQGTMADCRTAGAERIIRMQAPSGGA